MNVELKPIAESKVRQLGGEVFGVVIRDKRGRFATITEMGFVTWLDEDKGGEYAAYLEGMNSHLKAELKAARAQSGQGAEPVVDIGTQEREGFWQQPIDKYTQPAQQGSVPEGWKLVPVEPTAEMISAFEHAPCAENYTDAATWAWEAMLDAAPQPPQEGE